MIKAKSKNINITIILLLLSLLCGISDVRAINATLDSSGSGKSEAFDSKNAGNYYKFQMDDNGKKFTAYCIDPTGNTPSGGNGTGGYVEVKSNIPAEIQKAGDYACSNAKSAEDFSNVMRKKNATSDSKNFQSGQLDASGYDNSLSGTSGDLYNGIANNKSGATPKINVKVSDDKKTADVTITNGTPTGKLESAGDIKCTQSGNKYICRSKYACPDGNPNETSTGTVKYNPNGDSSASDSDGKKTCITKFYRSTDQADKRPQYLAACFCNNPENDSFQNPGNTNDGLPDDDGNYTETVELECTTEDELEDPGCLGFPDIPQIRERLITSNGSEICDEKGTTIINFNETAHDDDGDWFNWYKDDCPGGITEDYAGNDLDATKQFVKGTSYMDKNNLLSLCPIKCIEDFSMQLPGPDSKISRDDSVMINAGTFFTIDDGEEKIKSSSTISCFNDPSINNYNDYIRAQRSTIMDAYNYYATNDLYSNMGECNVGCSSPQCTGGWYDDLDRPILDSEGNPTGKYEQECREYTYTCTASVTGSSSKSLYELVGYNFSSKPNKKTISTTKQNTNKDTASAEAKSECNTTVTNYKKEYSKYDENWLAGQTREPLKKINEAKKYWEDVCLGWDISSLPLKDPTCPSNNMTFNWIDGEGTHYVTLSGNARISPRESQEREGSKSKDINDGICDQNGCENTYKNTEYYKTERQKISISTSYTFNNCFCVDKTNKVTGLGSCDSSCSEEKGEYKIKGFYVSPQSEYAIYEYWYDYSNDIGYDFSGDKAPCGRIKGVIDYAYTSSSWKPINTCYYSVNGCDGCEFECDKYGCNMGQKTCDRLCKVACVGGGCILDANAGFLATYRTISLNNFLAGRTNSIITAPDVTTLLAYNDTSLISLSAGKSDPDAREKASSTNTFPKSNWDTAKGVKAACKISGSNTNRKCVDAIDGKGETIYDDEPEYSFKLTPGDITSIKGYNKEHPDYNSLANLECNFVNDYYQCTSPFLDQLKVQKNSKFIPWEDYSVNEPFLGPAWK